MIILWVLTITLSLKTVCSSTHLGSLPGSESTHSLSGLQAADGPVQYPNIHSVEAIENDHERLKSPLSLQANINGPILGFKPILRNQETSIQPEKEGFKENPQRVNPLTQYQNRVTQESFLENPDKLPLLGVQHSAISKDEFDRVAAPSFNSHSYQNQPNYLHDNPTLRQPLIRQPNRYSEGLRPIENEKKDFKISGLPNTPQNPWFPPTSGFDMNQQVIHTNYGTHDVLNNPFVRRILNTHKREKKFLVIYPNGTVIHVDKVDDIIQKHPNHVLVNLPKQPPGKFDSTTSKELLPETYYPKFDKSHNDDDFEERISSLEPKNMNDKIKNHRYRSEQNEDSQLKATTSNSEIELNQTENETVVNNTKINNILNNANKVHTNIDKTKVIREIEELKEVVSEVQNAKSIEANDVPQNQVTNGVTNENSSEVNSRSRTVKALHNLSTIDKKLEYTTPAFTNTIIVNKIDESYEHNKEDGSPITVSKNNDDKLESSEYDVSNSEENDSLEWLSPAVQSSEYATTQKQTTNSDDSILNENTRNTTPSKIKNVEVTNKEYNSSENNDLESFAENLSKISSNSDQLVKSGDGQNNILGFKSERVSLNDDPVKLNTDSNKWSKLSLEGQVIDILYSFDLPLEPITVQDNDGKSHSCLRMAAPTSAFAYLICNN